MPVNPGRGAPKRPGSAAASIRSALRNVSRNQPPSGCAESPSAWMHCPGLSHPVTTATQRVRPERDDCAGPTGSAASSSTSASSSSSSSSDSSSSSSSSSSASSSSSSSSSSSLSNSSSSASSSASSPLES